MVAAHHHDRGVQQASLLELIKQYSQASVKGLHLAQVIGKVLSYGVHIWQKLGQLPLQVVRIDIPERLARTLDPLSMDERRAKPVTEWLTLGVRVEEGLEVARHFIKQNLLRLLHSFPRPNHAGHVLGELVELATRFFVTVCSTSIRCITRRARTPDLVGLADVVTGISQQ